MMMLTKFESKSNRVKGIAFHPKRSWILASLHNGCIQLWDYRMGALLERFDEHDGPVRGISFHHSQPLFVSGGDDFRIKVWNYKSRRCLFTLNGHLDYVRTVYFHQECPWILSASDDQTIRIWNWQSRTCIAILTGHNHYVMCAQFHPKEDLIVSASLDQTVRIWDVTGLRKKHAAPRSSTFTEPATTLGGQGDIFGNTDAVVKYVLEGHDRGANWATFHPTQPLIVSGADDRQVKLWRMSQSRAWELDTCRGHFNNVSSVLFHPRHDLIISNSEDKTIRVWDMNKRTAVQTFKREHDRFWILTAHPTLNLFAAGHDGGLIVFKLERERPPFAVYQNQLIYIRDKSLYQYDFTSARETLITALKRLPSYEQPRSLSYNPAEKAVLICSSLDYGSYELLVPCTESGESYKGNGNTAIFIARNRFAVFLKSTQSIVIRDMQNNVTKVVTPPDVINDIFHASPGNLLMSTANSVLLYDIQQKQTIAEVSTAPVKYAFWAPDMSMVAFLSKHTVVICDKNMEQLCMIHETIRLKSGAWDDSGIFMYSTLNHIKYVLPNGDKGIIRTLEQPVYLMKIKGKSVHCLDRDGKTRVINIDPTEYHFKLALVRHKHDEVLHIIRNSTLVGQAIIAYLQQKGYAEIALHFVKDNKTRFDLAIECGNIDVALETAKSIDHNECWAKLATEGLKQGNHQVAELAYQRTKNFDHLSFLYFITGSKDKLQKMMKIAEVRNDKMSGFHNALYLGDAHERIRIFKEVGQYPLAYLTAKSNGMEDEAMAILQQASLTPEDVGDLPVGRPLQPPAPIYPGQDINWPLLSVSRGFFAGAFGDNQSNPLAAQPFNVSNVADGGLGEIAGDWGADDDLGLGLPGENGKQQSQTGVGGMHEARLGDEVSGWDLDADLGISLNADIMGAGAGLHGQGQAGEFVTPNPGANVDSIWTQQSALVVDHIAAGMFESGMNLLNRQIGAVNFAPLKTHFMRVYQSARAVVSCTPSLPSLQIHLCRNGQGSNLANSLPRAPYTFQGIVGTQLQEAYRAFTAGKFPEVTTLFKSILHHLLFVVAESHSEAEEVNQLIGICREYLIGLSLERARKESQDVQRSLEILAYFTHCQMQPMHQQLALRLAMAQAFKTRNYNSAGMFARRLLELAPPQNLANQARQVQEMASKNPNDEVKLNYNQYNPFVTCASTLVPIYKGSPSVICQFCQASYTPECKGSLCTICEISEVGAQGTGLRLRN